MWSATIALVFIAVGLWFLYRKKKFSTFEELGIPGPKPNIFFGNLLEILNKDLVKCHQEWIEKYGKVVGYYFGGTPTLLVADIELMKKILIQDFQKFPNRPQIISSDPAPNSNETFSDQLITLRDKRWKEIRSIITPTFTTSKLRMMLPFMNSAVDSLMDNLEEKAKMGKSFNIYKHFQALTMDVIGRTAFGIDTDCQNNEDDIILKASRTIMTGTLKNLAIILPLSFPEAGKFWFYVNNIILALHNEGRNPWTDLSDIVQKVIKGRRENKSERRQDLLQIMIDAAVTESDLNKVSNEALTAKDESNEQDESNTANSSSQKSSKQLRYMVDKEIIDNSLLFFLAGFDTTSNTLAFTTHFLVKYPEIQERIREDIKTVIGEKGKLDYNTIQQLSYLNQVIMESQRMYPAVHLFVMREASEDIQYGPYKIKKGLSIQIPTYNLHRDPDLWPEPEKFDPDRFSPENKAKLNPLAFQSFGSGPRNCVGMRFAQLEVKLALARILSKYKLIASEETEKGPLTLRDSGATLAPAKGINLRAVPI